MSIGIRPPLGNGHVHLCYVIGAGGLWCKKIILYIIVHVLVVPRNVPVAVTLDSNWILGSSLEPGAWGLVYSCCYGFRWYLYRR